MTPPGKWWRLATLARRSSPSRSWLSCARQPTSRTEDQTGCQKGPGKCRARQPCIWRGDKRKCSWLRLRECRKIYLKVHLKDKPGKFDPRDFSLLVWRVGFNVKVHHWGIRSFSQISIRKDTCKGKDHVEDTTLRKLHLNCLLAAQMITFKA